MESENTNAPAVPGEWFQKPSGMTQDQALAKIPIVEQHPAFLNKKNEYLPYQRKAVLDFRDGLYPIAYPEGSEPTQGMAAELTKQGITKESLEAQIQKYEKRDEEDELEKGRRELDLAFGGRERTTEVLKKVQGAVKTWTTGSFVDRLFKSGTANSPVIVRAIHTIIEEIDRAEAAAKERKWRRGGKE